MTHNLVPSDQVEGAPVYGEDGKKIGTIERLMLDKRTGTVAYPLPWDTLKYDPVRQAYATTTTLERLREGPCELDGEAFDWGDRTPPYQHPYYWGV
jgi:hypothetical protein